MDFLAVALIIVSVAVVVGYYIHTGRERPPDPLKEITDRLLEHAEQLSRDQVANTERVLAAFVEQTKDSNVHMSGILTTPAREVPNEPPVDLPTPFYRGSDFMTDFSDPTDWGDLAPSRDGAVGIAPGDDNPTGIPGFAFEVPRGEG